MFIVIEGCDKNGKTQLANHISKILNFPIVKFSQPKQEPYIEYMDFLLNRKDPAILDRFYLGERVYGPVKRGKSELNEWQLRNIELVLMMRNPLCIYCETDENEIANNFVQDNEDYLLTKEIRPILDTYNNEISQSRLKWIRFNYLEDLTYERIDLIILHWYKEILHNLAHIQSLIPLRTFGNYYASTLILGDVSNIELEQEKYKGVNIGFANGPSSEILFGSLPKDRRNIAISNIKKVHLNNKIILKEELMIPNLIRVILLGKNAYSRFIEDGCTKNFHWLSIKKTFHPAFIARGGKTKEEYAKILKDLVI